MKKIWPHLILVPLLLTIPVVSSPDFDGSLSVFKQSPFQREFIRFLIAILFFYLNLSILLPKLFQKKYYLPYITITLAFFLLVVFLPYQLIPENNDFFGPPNMPFPKEGFPHPKFGNPPPLEPRGNFFQRNPSALHQKIFTSLMPFLFSFLSSLFIYRIDERRNLEKAKAKAELLNLKYQLQPHFLFNTLNSIYSLTLLKSEEAPEGILKLSNVMRYVVQESGNDFVGLQKELDYIKDYIDLQKMRTGDHLDFSYEQNGDPDDLKIAPLILVNFVENAFKYGFSTEESSKIILRIYIQENVLDFRIFNKIIHVNTEDQSLKIGLNNTIERLKQIYPKKYDLSINEHADTFEVQLKLQLS